jgi:AraC-like DNA-binding protein
VGVTPKEYLRIVRFQRALAAIKARSDTLGRLAHRHGYYDQAHMIADFRALAGCVYRPS